MAETDSDKKKTTLTRTVKDKWRAKQWFKVRAPGLFQHAALGETMATESESIIGRSLETTMQELGGGSDVGKAHIKLRFSITAITGDGIAETRLVGHDLTTDYVRRLARRKRSKIEAVVTVTTKDGVQIVLKAVAVGEQRLQSRLQTELRHRFKAILVESATTRTAPEFIRDMLGGELSRLVAQGLRTLYPLKKIEIRSSTILGTIPDEEPTSESMPAAETPIEPPASPEPSTA
ncbi:MAG: 30S ribosomal protein S3ae [Thermoplasmata archaeon]|nr:30S ribosomal protein S3ae [Thermoplasmata archaeon]